jgi:hypothetical protein
MSHEKMSQFKIGKEVKMKKLSLISVATLTLVFVAVLAVVFPLNALANPDILEVSPTSHDFEDVEVGTTVTKFVSLRNVNGRAITVESIEFLPGSSGDFSIMYAPPIPFDLAIGEAVEVEVAFTPSAEGYVSAVLEITSTDSTNPTQQVFLGGAGRMGLPRAGACLHSQRRAA